MSIPRRGYIAAGLAAAVVGSLGVVSTMNAGAGEVSGTPAAVTAVADLGGPTPPAVLPWGEQPEPVKQGVAGTTSKTLAAAGADIAPSTSGRSLTPEPEYRPKGYTSTERTLTQSRTTAAPQPPVLSEPVPGTTFGVKYHYAAGYQYAQTDGTYANLVIGKPWLAPEDYHSLAEIAVQSADGRQIVEVGWTVDRGLNGNEDPHLFVYHWVDGAESCYNACGFRQYSQIVVPGDTLPQGVSKRFGVQHYNGAWWIAYDTEWVGYFPDSLWGGGFTRSGLLQWFGEVAASGSRPCTDMGTGYDPNDYAGARVGTIALLNGPEVAFTLRSSSADSDWPVYPTLRLSDRTFRYGGSGAC